MAVGAPFYVQLDASKRSLPADPGRHACAHTKTGSQVRRESWASWRSAEISSADHGRKARKLMGSLAPAEDILRPLLEIHARGREDPRPGGRGSSPPVAAIATTFYRESAGRA